MTPSSIVITGASGGLGRALSEVYAGPGRALLLLGRNATRLAEAERRSRELRAEVRVAGFPLADNDALVEAITSFDREFPIELLIVNAGDKTGNRSGIEEPSRMADVLDVNLGAAMRTVQAALPGMMDRGRGHIALVSSTAALSPHADLLSYSAAKAGLRAYGTALRRALLDSGVKVTIITPGFIDTPMTDRHKGPTPFVVSSERAARIIRRGLDRQARYITFPKVLSLLIFLSGCLPSRLSDWIDRGFRAEILPRSDDPSGEG
ncbi:MAG: SDR family NAD(P)-dependent oxidoreductase [Paracoccaceae bacterium]